MYYEKFAELCQKRNVTAADIARGTGIATATLTSWKKGRYTPKIDKLQLIADYFHVPLSFFTDQENGQSTGYYTDTETARLAQKLFTDHDIRIETV